MLLPFVRSALLALALWFLGGCTAILAARGDPDMSVLQVGAPRTAIDTEMGQPETVTETNGGSLAVYAIKLGAPKDKSGVRSSLIYAGIGATAGVGAGVLWGIIIHVGTVGLASGTPQGVAVGLTVGAGAWLIGETIGTFGQLNRLSKAKPHKLEVSYDRDNRLVGHKLELIDDGA